MRARSIVVVSCLALVLSSCASDARRERAVRVVTEKELVLGCQYVGIAADNEINDFQKKTAKLGGNIALLTPERKFKGGYFGSQDYTTADVYRCEGER
jgi:hypothetical protein